MAAPEKGMASDKIVPAELKPNQYKALAEEVPDKEVPKQETPNEETPADETPADNAPDKRQDKAKNKVAAKEKWKEEPNVKGLFKSIDYKPRRWLRIDNPHHYTVLRSIITSYMRMQGIRGTTNPSTEAWAGLVNWTMQYDSYVTFCSKHTPEVERRDQAIHSLLQDCVHQLKKMDTRLMKEPVDTGIMKPVASLVATSKFSVIYLCLTVGY